MLLATASAILILAVIAAAILFLRSYRPTPVSVVERALIPHDLRAKIHTDARLRLRLHQHRRAGRSHLADTRDVASVAAPVSPPVTTPLSARATAPALCAPPSLHTPSLVQSALVHNQAGAPLPGSYFRIVESPSQETIVSNVRGPWASEIVTDDGRITLPDSHADAALACTGGE